jgi:hypothetical protein
MDSRGWDVAWSQVFDVASGVCCVLGGISLGQAGLSSGGAAQVGLVPSKFMRHAGTSLRAISGNNDYYITSGPRKGVISMPGAQFESEQVDPILIHIYESMPVYDQTGHMIGTVAHVYLGEVAECPEPGGYIERTPSVITSSEESLIEEFAKAILLTEQISEFWREQLLSYGFIRINSSGLFSSDRYALPSQIAGVVEDCVLLCVEHGELLKA